MKNNSIYLLLLFNTANSISAAPETLLSKREDPSLVRENPTSTKESCGSLSELIIASFLQARKSAIKENNIDSINRLTTEQKLFQVKWTAQLQDINMDIKLEGSEGASVVIINTSVQGSPEDFEGKNLLESEQQLLKYILIKAYLSKVKESPSKNPTSVVLDKNSKVTQSPTPMVMILKNLFGETREISHDRKSMELITVLNKQEFDALVKKYFVFASSDVGTPKRI